MNQEKQKKEEDFMKKKIELKKKGKSNKGITLIALVITIIVLLILAAVSIATLTGENGILTKASTAKKETEMATEDEKVRLAVAASIDNNGDFDSNLLPSELEKYELTGTPSGDNIIVDTKNKIYTIDSKGKITETNKTNTDQKEEIVTAPESYVKSFNAGKGGNDNIIGYIVKNTKNQNAYDMIFVGTGEMGTGWYGNTEGELREPLSDYASFGSMTTWKADFINIKFSSGIINIPEWTFNGSNTLEKIVLPNTIERIGDGAFYGNNNIKNITIPASVKNMGYDVFCYWTLGQTITIMGSIDEWSSGWNGRCDANIVYKNQ